MQHVRRILPILEASCPFLIKGRSSILYPLYSSQSHYLYTASNIRHDNDYTFLLRHALRYKMSLFRLYGYDDPVRKNGLIIFQGFYSDGQTKALGYEPCSASTEYAACCNIPQDICLPNGLCLDTNSGRVYKNACTDPTWSSPFCAYESLNLPSSCQTSNVIMFIQY